MAPPKPVCFDPSLRIPMNSMAPLLARLPRCFSGLLTLTLAASPNLPLQAQTTQAATNKSVLQQRYEAAQRYQAKGDLPHAAEQYRIFIADSLGQVAIGRVNANQYDKAADNFDEALRLVPDFPMLQLEYARAALGNGNLEHAGLLARGVIQNGRSSPKIRAGAYVVLGRALLKMNKDAEARQQLESAVALDPSFENGYELAVADLDLGDRAAAAQIFTEMVSSFGDSAAIHMYFGQAYGTSDFQTDAVREFKEAIAKDPRLPGVHYSLAAAYLSTAGNSKLAEAQAELRQEIAVSPNNAAAYAALGHLLAGQHSDPAGDAEAESDLKHAIELNPKDPDAFLYLGQFYADTKHSVEAEAALRRSIEFTVDPSRNAYQVQKAHYLLGRLLMQTGQPDEGKKEIAAAQDLMQQNLSQSQSRLSDYLQDGKPSRETTPGPAMPMTVEEKRLDPAVAHHVDAFEKQIGPAIADSYNNLGAIAGSEGDFRSALQFFARTAEWNPSLPGLDSNWGRAAFQAGAFSQAVSLLGRALQQHPDNEELRASLGISQFELKDFPAARDTLRPLDGKSGESPQVQYAFADSLVETGDLSGGITRLLALENAAPKVPEVHRSLGEAYAAQKAPAAASELEAAIRLNPKDVEAHEALARLQLSHGDAKAAVLNLQAALKLDPASPTLRQELAEADRKAGRN